MNTNDIYWKSKLVAWVHDPAEKALVLFRGDHEAGTVRNLCKELFGSERVPPDFAEFVKEADRWAAGADRPDIPWKPGTSYPEWSKVSFTEEPELVHPVSPGDRVDNLTTFGEINAGSIKAVSTDHFKNLIVQTEKDVLWKETFLRFWRFGPATPAKDLNLLWQVLPADTRSPDHTIWDHLKLCSAFAGIFALNDEPGLLVVSLGPVQGFIAQARSTSDLWAGSHFLSQLCWQAMLPIVEEFGPDAVLFPDLHGVPVVDQWLVEQGLWPEDKTTPWEKGDGTSVALDRDPRMSAALPNRFVAIVPSKQINEITRELTGKVRKCALDQAMEAAAKKVFSEELPDTAKEQIREQLKDFPEIYWSAVPWSVVKELNGKIDPQKLFDMLNQFLPDGADSSNDDTWDILSKPAESKNGEWKFYEPNRGAAYTHLYSLTDRIHGAVKTARPFEDIRQEGYRCSICGEREWLTDNRNALLLPPGEKRKDTVWSKLAEKEISIVRSGEHLCAWCTLKRFWPSVFPEKIGAKKGTRFVVSTHTMALAPSIEKVADRADEIVENYRDEVMKLSGATEMMDRAVFPRRLWHKLENISKTHDVLFKALSKLPVLLDCISDQEEDDELQNNALRGDIKKLFGVRNPETYYALILMDGDRMGEWVAGTNPEQLPEYKDILHSKTATLLDHEFSSDEYIQVFLKTKRPNTPARHQAISRALNSFSINLARIVVEEVFTGKLIYSGGDDLLAMVSLNDLPGLMLALRALYSGVLFDSPEKWQYITGREDGKNFFKFKKGYVLLDHKGEKRLFATMGPKATASMGAVIAHHKAPLGRVLRTLRESEKRAKDAGGRNAFCITIEKRAGGTSHLVGKWWFDDVESLDDPMATTIGTLIELSRSLGSEGVSRRAAYVMHDMLRDLPDDTDAIRRVVAFRLNRQGVDEKEADKIAERIVTIASKHETVSTISKKESTRGEVPPVNKWLQDFFITAEFLARRIRPEEGGDAS